MQMADHKILTFDSDPNDRDLRTTRRIERRHMGERRLCDQFAYCFRHLQLLSPADTLRRCPLPVIMLSSSKEFQSASIPPSTGIDAPVMYEALAEATKTIT